MKTVKIIFVAFLAIALGSNSYAQAPVQSKKSTIKTETIKVWGNCETCQARIEKAAKVDGVTKASWDKTTKLLTLMYDPSKVNSDDIQKKIAATGDDTQKYKADDIAYAKLPGCCQYERKK